MLTFREIAEGSPELSGQPTLTNDWIKSTRVMGFEFLRNEEIT
jgi:hypothetical protein